MISILVLKLLVVLAFLVVFWRRPSLVWGIGLMTVSSAVLLDTVLGTFGREEMAAELGFFGPVLNGLLFAGMALWLWGWLRPLLPATAVAQSTAPNPAPPAAGPNAPVAPSQVVAPPQGAADDGVDRRMLYEQIRDRFGREDVLDLMFDLGIGETEVMTLHQDMNQLIVNIMNVAEARGDAAALALGVERILTPPPPEHLPRLEKISVASPPTILRQYLLAHADLETLSRLAAALALDWEQIGVGNKKTQVRELLLYLYRRNRIDDLIAQLQSPAFTPSDGPA